ncbi:DNA cytosine methyltransferase [Streptomyces sp. NRRL B-24484]|uniref:DNA cytosine methyltransferase n=1 Tax=Streptomyces sp. NRRL B-24484 TaxID=1463833 RepID=UPI0004C0A141|nr:DNA cytosine methyltransferase [Streptomyces sp. NRRL B-24484]
MLKVLDEFAGAGGTSQGVHAVPGTELIFAANHNRQAVDSHAANFPDVEHFVEDIARTDITKFPSADIFCSSPSCPPWTDARGKRRDFDNTTQGVLFGEKEPDPEIKRARALMEEVPRYLRAMNLRGTPVLVGMVENVVQVRKWDEWDRWIKEIEAEGYEVKVIAYNSAHARPVRCEWSPQSRNRAYVAYWHKKLGRRPDWDKWLRPRAWCPTCDKTVDAIQVFKQPGTDMGTHGRHGQYYYRCPNSTCRHRIVEPETLGADTAIDWTIAGTRLAEREEPLAPATIERIVAGLLKYMPAQPTAPSGQVPILGETEPTRPTTAPDGWEPFIVPLRGGGDKGRFRPVSAPLTTVTASGNHHGLVTAPNARLQRLLVPYYSNGRARPVTDPVGTITTKDRWSLITHQLLEGGRIHLDDVRFRMLTPAEIGKAMAFRPGYIVLGSAKDQVRQYGNAVTPPVAELIISALVEAITGEDLPRDVLALAA